MKTEEKIVSKALELFNEKGIEYVGMRELAVILGIRVSNITYYFPTKDDLVNRIALDLNKENSKIIIEYPDLTMHGFLDMIHQAFHNHTRYRCLFLSFVHYMTHNKAISEKYKQTQINRTTVMSANLAKLRNEGYLKPSAESEIDNMVSVITLIARFWISEAAVTYRHLTSQEQIDHYSRVVANFLIPYATAKGKKEINDFVTMLSRA